MSTTTIETLTINGHRLTLKNLDKPFWPEEGITKGDIAEYYIKSGSLLSPHLRTVPLPGPLPRRDPRRLFYQKNFPTPAVGGRGAVKPVSVWLLCYGQQPETL